MSKVSKKILVALLTVIAAITFAVTGAMAFSAESGETAVTEKNDVKITKVDQTNGTAITVTFDLSTDRTGNGTNVNNAAEVGNYIYYNKEVCLNAKFDVHMRSQQLWFYAKAGTTLAVNDEILFVKGLHFPVVTADGVAATEYKDYLGDTTKFKYTEEGWVNQTELDKAAEAKVKLTLGGGAKASSAALGGFGAEFLNFSAEGYTNASNHTNILSWVETKGYMLYNGSTTFPSQVDISMASGIKLRLNSDATPYTFKDGDVITVLEGMHIPGNGDSWGSLPTYANQVYNGYVNETIQLKVADGKFEKVVTEASEIKLNKIKPVTEAVADAMMPDTYKITVDFDLRIISDDTKNLQDVDAWATKFMFNNKTVKQWNAEISSVNDDDEPVPTISMSASGSTLNFVIVKAATSLWNGTDTLKLSIAKDFVAGNGNFVKAEADIARYYLTDLGYWSKIEPSVVEKTTKIDIVAVADFQLIDNNANGDIGIVFSSDIAAHQLLSYNFHPEYRLTLPAGYYPQLADELASNGSIANFNSHISINGKTISEMWAEHPELSAEAKSSSYQCHIGAVNNRTLSIRANVNNGFSGNDVITIKLLKGMVFSNGAYLDHDITVTYSPKNGDTAAKTSYSVVAESIALSSDKTELKVGEKAQLTASTNPSSATSKVEYVISDSKVLSVSESGEITALKAGTATVKATIDGKESELVTFTVTQPATSVVVESGKLSLKVGATSQIKATVSPSDTSDKLTYTSDKTDVATVDANGKITAIKKGTAIITVTCGEKTATVTVTVTQPATSISVGEDKVSLKVGETFSITTTITPSNADDKATFKSDKTDVATVDANGKITAIKKGTAIITVTCGEKTATVTVTVNQPATGISVGEDKVSIIVGETANIKTTLTPSDSDDKVTYKSDKSDIATVDANGKITGIKEGTAIITVTCGEKTATVTVTVTAAKKGCGSNVISLLGVLTATFMAAFVFIKRK